MTDSAAARIPHERLLLGRSLGDGGQGKVWEIEKRLINKTWPVAYKEYKPTALGELRVGTLERMVAFLPAQPAAVGEWMARNTAWPAALVTRGQDVCGFLMRQIPDEYFLTLPSGDRKTAGFEFLLNSLAYVDRMVGEVTPRQMMGLLLALADTLQRLHGLGVVAGDLSPKNLLFTLAGPRPGCFLIDCDAMGLGGDWALKPVQTPGWELPAGEAVGTRQGDVYKFALLAVRLFLHEQHGQDTGALRRVDGAVGDLAERALRGTAPDRPALSEWLDPLRRAFDTAPVTWPATAGPKPRPTPPTPPPSPPPTATPSGPPPGPGRTTSPGRTMAGSGPVTAHAPQQATPQGSRTGCAIAVAVLLLVALVVAVVAWVHGSNGDSGSGGNSSSSTGTLQGEAGSSDSLAEQARTLDDLLEENAGRRGGVADAVQSMTRCTGLQSARSVFTEAADARDDLVTRLDALSGSALPDGLLSTLRTAWRSSEEADRAYARVVDEVSGNCSADAVNSSGAWQDAADASAEATRAKKDFVTQWNPLAEQYGLTTLVWSDL
ncbi:hypothetical protein [Streptomyces sp. Ru71]|uniref:hypothetical protein n=1 Tax=Streptomyces sp. Ru71 TaxID=2080746 RepID=UPI0015E2B13C|nr:hypothetical protein [Streptomyces sp. Ru71]